MIDTIADALLAEGFLFGKSRNAISFGGGYVSIPESTSDREVWFTRIASHFGDDHRTIGYHGITPVQEVVGYVLALADEYAMKTLDTSNL